MGHNISERKNPVQKNGGRHGHRLENAHRQEQRLREQPCQQLTQRQPDRLLRRLRLPRLLCRLGRSAHGAKRLRLGYRISTMGTIHT